MNAEWFRAHLPDWLLGKGPWQMEHWQWLGLVVGLVLAWIVGRLAGRLTSWVLRRLVSRTDVTWDDEIVRRLHAPLTFGWTIGIVWTTRSGLDLPEKIHALMGRGLRAAMVLGIFWGLLRAVDVVAAALGHSEWSKSNPSSRSLVHLGGRVAKTLIAAMGVITVVADLGYPVASLIAGLGVGGVALALASQKTVENLFGAFSIGFDQPFRIGDFVRLENMVGTIETLGLRSTRIRTLDRTLVTIPNSALSEMKTESFTARDRIRLACTIGVEYGTTAAQMRQVLEGLGGVLKEHPKFWTEGYMVRFKEFGASSLDIEVMAWFTTADWNEFVAIREEILLSFMEVVEKAGASFAFPSQTVYVRQS